MSLGGAEGGCMAVQHDEYSKQAEMDAIERQEWIDSSSGISRARVRIASSASRSGKSWVCMRSSGCRRASISSMALR